MDNLFLIASALFCAGTVVVICLIVFAFLLWKAIKQQPQPTQIQPHCRVCGGAKSELKTACVYCGYDPQNPDGEHFCPGCGIKVSNSACNCPNCGRMQQPHLRGPDGHCVRCKTQC